MPWVLSGCCCLEERRGAFDKQQAILKQRERAAYRQGIMKTAALALVVIGLLTGLAIYAFLQRREAQEQTKDASAQSRAPQEQARIVETPRLAAQASEKKAEDARDQADEFSDHEVNSFVHHYARFVDEYVQACQAAKTGDTTRFVELQKQVEQLENQVASVTVKLKAHPDEIRRYEEVIAGYTQRMIDATKQ